MSFMFNAYPYDDPNAINHIDLPKNIVGGNDNVAEAVAAKCAAVFAKKKGCKLCLDGYPTAKMEPFVTKLAEILYANGIECETYDAEDLYRPADEIEEILRPFFPTDRKIDPVLLFGKVFTGDYCDLFDSAKVKALLAKLNASTGKVVVVFGHGAACETLRDSFDLCVWMDVTPKAAVLAAHRGELVNIGEKVERPFCEVMRRAYYCDYYLSERLRGRLLHCDAIDFYINASHPEALSGAEKGALNQIFMSLAERPYRCRPVYIEGVWGGQFIKKIRRLPEEMDNVAWCFDLIPLEVSIVAEGSDGKQMEFPYHTFVQKMGTEIMGAEAVNHFHGYFPVRFNYDDTWHSNGNMSIQVHPGEKYCKENFSDFGRQDESYYIVATGHGAKTYCGFQEDADVAEFVAECKKSEREKTEVAYDKYVRSVPSVPGRQFMQPGGTIHASGRNQLILEIGSLTIGSYTFKMYDYMRLDLNGKPRPIHSIHGENVLNPTYRGDYVDNHFVPDPVLVRSGDGFREYIVGQCEQLYFTLHRLEFDKKIEDNTGRSFHVLVLVDGEHVRVQSKKDPSLCYHMNFLDMVVVPASVGEYEIINEGSQPVVVHKTYLKEDEIPLKKVEK